MTTILVVDDEPDLEPLITQRFRRQIRRGEMSFVFAGDGEEALLRLEQHPEIGLVLSDINMPKMDGLTLLDRLAGMERTVEAVVVSAYGDMKNIRTAMNRGAFDFVTKPIDLMDLESTIDKARRHMDRLRSALEARDQLLLLQKELADARALQQSILRKDFPAGPEVEIFAHMEPAKDVGGDFYDFFAPRADTLSVVVADVAGKGMSAALFMAISRTVLRACAAIDPAPALCLARANELLCEGNDTAMFVTLFYGVIDFQASTLTYSVAGHPPPYRIGADGVVEALPRTGGIALGVLENAAFEERVVQVRPGDKFFLFTDGVTEATDDRQQEFGPARLEAALSALTGSDPPTLLQKVVSEVSSFSTAAPSDDVTCMALRFLGASRRRTANPSGTGPGHGEPMGGTFDLVIRNRLTELGKVHAGVRQFGEKQRLTPELMLKLELACEELITNIISYAYDDDAGHDIEISFAVRNGEVIVTITDDGRPFSPLQAATPDVTAPVEERAVGGLGIHLVRSHMDGVEYHRVGDRNRITLTKSLSGTGD